MSTQLKFFKVNTLPSTLQADAFYYVANGNYAESYITDQAGVAKAIGNSPMINKLIQDALLAQGQSGNEVEIVADIAARNTLTANATRNVLILVVDATGDSSVKSGSALYAYRSSDKTTFKVAEYESMDVVVKWADIQGKPTSSAAAIDTAVSQSHTHANKTVLDKLNEDASGNPTYGGNPISTSWSETSW